jgi:hypothetical protein
LIVTVFFELGATTSSARAMAVADETLASSTRPLVKECKSRMMDGYVKE